MESGGRLKNFVFIGCVFRSKCEGVCGGPGLSLDKMFLLDLGPPIGTHCFICDSSVETVCSSSSETRLQASARQPAPGPIPIFPLITGCHGACSPPQRRHFTQAELLESHPQGNTLDVDVLGFACPGRRHLPCHCLQGGWYWFIFGSEHLSPKGTYG